MHFWCKNSLHGIFLFRIFVLKLSTTKFLTAWETQSKLCRQEGESVMALGGAVGTAERRLLSDVGAYAADPAGYFHPFPTAHQACFDSLSMPLLSHHGYPCFFQAFIFYVRFLCSKPIPRCLPMPQASIPHSNPWSS